MFMFMLCQANLLEAEFQLKGSDAYAARFGQTIADLGDLDDDGYPGTLLPFVSSWYILKYSRLQSNITV